MKTTNEFAGARAAVELMGTKVVSYCLRLSEKTLIKALAGDDVSERTRQLVASILPEPGADARAPHMTWAAAPCDCGMGTRGHACGVSR